MRDAYILEAIRTPTGKNGGSLGGRRKERRR